MKKKNTTTTTSRYNVFRYLLISSALNATMNGKNVIIYSVSRYFIHLGFEEMIRFLIYFVVYIFMVYEFKLIRC